MLQQFELEFNTTETTNSIYCAKGEGTAEPSKE